jgi:hypothetical protein
VTGENVRRMEANLCSSALAFMTDATAAAATSAADLAASRVSATRAPACGNDTVTAESEVTCRCTWAAAEVRNEQHGRNDGALAASSTCASVESVSASLRARLQRESHERVRERWPESERMRNQTWLLCR